MALEAASFISNLVATNPPSSDLTSQGDDHIRLMKAVLQATLPNASRAFYIPEGANKTANYSVLVGDQNKIFTADATAGAITFTLPVVGLFFGYSIMVVKTDATANLVNLTPTSGTANGVASISLGSQYNGAMMFWTGSTWIVQKFASNKITGNVEFVDEVTFDDVVTFVQGIEFQGPLDIQGVAEFSAQALFSNIVQWSGQDLVDGAAVAWNMALQPYAKWTAAGNRTLGAPTGESAGQWVLLKYVQDAAGNRIPTFNAAYKGIGGTVPRPGLNANEETLYLGFVRGADDVILMRLWTSGHRQPMIYNDVDMGDYASTTTYTHTHALGYMPKVELFLKIMAAEFGYLVGDYVTAASLRAGSDAEAPALKINATDAKLRVGDSTANIQKFNFSGEVSINSLATPPKVIFRVWE